MHFTFTAVMVSLAALVSGAAVRQTRQVGCAEADRFGVLSVTPSTLAAGDSFTVSADFSCAINWFGIRPQYIDYYIEVPSGNNGHEPAILLARRTLSPCSLKDTFTTSLPYAYYFANASYAVVLDTTYPINGTNGTPYSVVGGIEFPITVLDPVFN